jgi:hypothetical protein
MSRASLLFVFLFAACGGAQAPKPEEPGNAAAPTKSEASESGASESGAPDPAKADSAPATTIPTECAKSGRLCMPDQKFTKRMCNDSFPSIALYLFGNGFPFTRGYLTRKTQAWNAEGGASDNSFLEFDEEVLLLAERGTDPNAMQVSGAGGGYMAMRWNG